MALVLAVKKGRFLKDFSNCLRHSIAQFPFVLETDFSFRGGLNRNRYKDSQNFSQIGPMVTEIRCCNLGLSHITGKCFTFFNPLFKSISLDSRRKSNIWHCIKKRKTALKFFTFKLRLGPLLVHLSTRLICQIIPIYMLFEIFAKKFNFVIAIAKKIEENVKCLRLVKITFL